MNDCILCLPFIIFKKLILKREEGGAEREREKGERDGIEPLTFGVE